MSYPGSFFKWQDNSAIPSALPITEIDNSPLFAAVFTSDMGPEDWTTVVGKEFFNLYGSTISFNKHGQPLLQAAMQINNGAKLYCKRIVAKDATYANIGVIATITPATKGGVQLTNESGEALYYEKDTATGENLSTTTTNATTTLDNTSIVNNDPVLSEATAATVTYEPFSVENATSKEDVYDAFNAEYNAATNKYPLFIFVENGRGVSTKAWSITPNYELSKNNKYMVYTLTLSVGDNSSSFTFTFNPDFILDGKSFCLQQRVLDNTSQIVCKEYDAYINEFMTALATAISTDDAPVTVADIKNQDILFGFTRKNLPLSTNLVYNTEAISLDSAYGNKLINGSTGSFGDYPLNATSKDPSKDTYVAAMLRAFDEDLYPEIYDNENNKFIAVFDANYPVEVKRKIEELAIFREDFLFFRDFGTTGHTTFSEIKETFEGTEERPGVARSKFVKPYPLYGDIMDPYTQKQITVTLTYLMAMKFISHANNGINNPFCGIRYGVTFPEVIYGTVNFVPAVTPKYDQKTQMIDLRINYCAYHNELLVMETDYTTQEEYTQWSFGGNVAATQAVIRAIRTRCPSTRYALTTAAGLEDYKNDINNKVIKNFVDWFDVLTFEYVGDAITLANKQYYAAINVKFTDFIQEEHFTITALPAVSASE